MLSGNGCSSGNFSTRRTRSPGCEARKSRTVWSVDHRGRQLRVTRRGSAAHLMERWRARASPPIVKTSSADVRHGQIIAARFEVIASDTPAL